MIYLDNAATTFPKPGSVCDEVMRCMCTYCGNPGRSGHVLSAEAGKKVFECRCGIASLFHSDAPENVVFTCNATAALNLAIKSFLKRGDHVLISDMEHNSVIRPVCALAGQGISYSIYRADPDPETVLSAIRAKLRPATRMLLACHSSNVCGLELPLGAIGDFCRSHHLIFIVDAAQSAGNRAIDMETVGADVLCAPGHKGLYGPQGSGFALFAEKYRDSVLSGRLKTVTEGGSGTQSRELRMPDFLPERMEAGTLSTPGIAGLCEGVRIVSELGEEAIYTHENTLYRRAREIMCNTAGVTVYGKEYDAGTILLFNSDHMMPDVLADELDRRGICVRAGLHCAPLAHRRLGTPEGGAVRVSFSMYNTEDEVETLCRAVRELCG